MTDQVRGRPFEKGNQAAKNRRRRVAYDKIFSRALESEGESFVDKIISYRDCDDPGLSLRACDLFFKYARPPEKDELPTSPDTSYFREFGLTLEEGLQLKKDLQENQAVLIATLSDKIIRNRVGPGVG
jgi:hypothetical protein